jgi:hypothetical protein
VAFVKHAICYQVPRWGFCFNARSYRLLATPITYVLENEQLMANDFIMNTVLKSNFIIWTFTKITKDQTLTFPGATPEMG